MSSEIHQQDHFYETQFSLCSKIFQSVVLPSDINENWVPSLIFTVVITFGFYAQKYIGQQLLLPEQTRKRISACKKILIALMIPISARRKYHRLKSHQNQLPSSSFSLQR